jgi:hypothetical protein
MHINDDLDKYQLWTAGGLEGDETWNWRRSLTATNVVITNQAFVDQRWKKRPRCSGVLATSDARVDRHDSVVNSAGVRKSACAGSISGLS